MRVPVELLVLICLAVGVLPQLVIQAILVTAANPVVAGNLPEFSLALWHGFNLPLVMSFVALFGGIGLYWLMRRGMNTGTCAPTNSAQHTPPVRRA